MHIKPGVKFEMLSPQMLLGAIIVMDAYEEMGQEATITSGTDGTHKQNSLHYSGNAMDFRTRDVDPSRMKSLVAEIKRRLGENFDVVLEKDHLHVEFDPKYPEPA